MITTSYNFSSLMSLTKHFHTYLTLESCEASRASSNYYLHFMSEEIEKQKKTK